MKLAGLDLAVEEGQISARYQDSMRYSRVSTNYAKTFYKSSIGRREGAKNVQNLVQRKQGQYQDEGEEKEGEPRAVRRETGDRHLTG
jgi:hypothetical protein